MPCILSFVLADLSWRLMVAFSCMQPTISVRIPQQLLSLQLFKNKLVGMLDKAEFGSLDSMLEHFAAIENGAQYGVHVKGIAAFVALGRPHRHCLCNNSNKIMHTVCTLCPCTSQHD